MRKPAFPPNRVLRQGELPCIVCGSGRTNHSHRDHAYTRPESTLARFLRWLRS